MRKFVFSGVLVLAALGTQAQVAPVLPAVPQPRPDTTLINPATDSAQAVRNLFRKRRNGGSAYTGVGGLVLATGLLAGPFSLGPTESVAISVPFLALGVSKLVRFGHKKENAIIKAYQAGRPLPADVRKRLRQEFFAPAR